MAKNIIALGITMFLASVALPAFAGDPFSVNVEVSPLSVRSGGRLTVESTIQISPGHYLYKTETGLGMQAQPGFAFAPGAMPPAVSKTDPFLRKQVEIYENSVTLQGGVSVAETVKPGQYTLVFETRFQGCSHETCFLPTVREQKVQILVLASGGTGDGGRGARDAASHVPRPTSLVPSSAGGDFQSTLSQRGLLYTIALCFMAGILLSLTPCVYPLIPITVGVIGSSSLGRPMRGFFLSVAYVLGISLTYALLGVVAASTGRLFGSFVQSTWVAGFVIVVFLALSLSMFGFYELPMFGGLSERYQGRVGAGLVGVFVMGLIAGLVASPCVGPVIVGLLVYISTTGNIVLGFLMLFVMGWGMGLLLIVLGTFSGAISLLPRSGEWMVLVKHVFGLLMLSGAFYYLKGLVPWPIFLGALGVTLCVLGVLAGRFDALTPKKGAVTRIRKTFALLCVVLGACVIVSIFLPRLGISLFAPAQEAARPDAMGKKGIRWLSSEQEGLAKARAEARPVMIDFWANWCAVCVHLDETTYADPQVVREAQRFVTVKIDCTDSSSPAVKELLARYGVVGLPTIVFIDSKGQWQREKTVNKYISAAELLAIMRGVQ